MTTKYKVEKWDKTKENTYETIGYFNSKEEAKKITKGYRIREDLNTDYMEVYTKKGNKYMYFIIEISDYEWRFINGTY